MSLAKLPVVFHSYCSRLFLALILFSWWGAWPLPRLHAINLQQNLSSKQVLMKIKYSCNYVALHYRDVQNYTSAFPDIFLQQFNSPNISSFSDKWSLHELCTPVCHAHSTILYNTHHIRKVASIAKTTITYNVSDVHCDYGHGLQNP